MTEIVLAPASLAPLENLVIDPTISGERGRNRANGQRQITANDDRSAVLAWLALYADSSATLSSYRKEAERLLLWCLLQRRCALSDLTHEDLLVFERFLADPQPAAIWVMAPGMKPARSSPGWRPFAGSLRPASQKQAMTIINGLFSWLVEAGYLAGNPLSLRRRRRAAKAAATMSRFLPSAHWSAVRESIEAMPRSNAREVASANRARWVFSLFYIGCLRITELCTAMMGSFEAITGSDGKARWWLSVVGKGDKIRRVPATDQLLAELKRYRVSLGLPPLPHPGDRTPAVLPLIGDVVFLSRAAVYDLVKDVLADAAARVRALGPEHEAAAVHLERASPHWLRHTAGSDLARKVGVVATRDTLGHANLSTTNIYIHIEDEKRHDAINEQHAIAWSA
jgi:integrase/recombinase XerD